MALTDNIVAYWKFDESSGNAEDSTANNNDLTNNNTATFAAGKINNGTFLTAATPQYFSIADASQTGLDLTGDCSFNFWFKIPALGSGSKQVYLTSKFGGTQRSYKLGFTYNAGTPTTTFIFDTSALGALTTERRVTVGIAPASEDTWTMYTIVFDSASTGDTTFYINGSSVGVNDGAAAAIFNSTSAVEVGYSSFEGNNSVDVAMDEYGIWSRTLSGAEVTELYNSGTGLTYPFSSPGPATLESWDTVTKATIESMNTTNLNAIESWNTVA